VLTALLNGGTLDNECRPEVGMPSGSKPNPSRLNSLAAYLIDVRRAWLLADVDGETREATLLYHGQGLTHGAIGQAQKVSTSTARRRVRCGVSAVLAGVNGLLYDPEQEPIEEFVA
jgi:hypothetical protein